MYCATLSIYQKDECLYVFPDRFWVCFWLDVSVFVYVSMMFGFAHEKGQRERLAKVLGRFAEVGGRTTDEPGRLANLSENVVEQGDCGASVEKPVHVSIDDP